MSSSSKVPSAADVVIIGGGFAGVATAWALARRGIADVVLLEREPALGRHTSGRGAGVGRQLTDDDPTTMLTVRGAALLRSELGDAWSETGGVLGFDDDATAEVYVARAAQFGIAAELVNGAGLARRWPGLTGASVELGLYVPSDGVIDIVLLLARMEATIDARVYTDAAVLGLEAGRAAGEPHLVRTARGAISARVVVEATGAWAGQLLGALPPTIVKRHVFVLDARPGADMDASGPTSSPWLWHLGEHELYARGHADGVLASGCDATSTTAGDYAIEPDAEAAFRARLAITTPGLAAAPLLRQWACVRTFTGDRRMRLERDAERPWLVWAIGLGGHGVTASPAVGEAVAAAVVAALKS